MRPGGREALWEVISWHINAQRRFENSARYSGLLSSVIAIPLAAAALLSRQNANPGWGIFLVLTIVAPLLSWIQWVVTRNKLQRLHDGELELRGYISNVIFDYEIWRDLMEDDVEHEVRLGPIELARIEVSFKDRVTNLFKNYPQLASKKYLEPFPGWYRKMYRSGSQRDNQYVDHYWQYSLALLLQEEFLAARP
jgi:hypothetical protein